jgi:hypothetical protein
MKIREHRGGLDEAMQTVAEIEPTLEAITAEISSKIKRPVTPGSVHLRSIGFDRRTQWDTHIVTVDDWGVYGFTDGPIA